VGPFGVVEVQAWAMASMTLSETPVALPRSSRV
jgi:hypothetical protein